MNPRKAALRAAPDWLDNLDLGDDAPAAVGMFAPSARWLVPSAEDKARVREAVEAQDRAAALEAREWDALRLDAVQRDVPPVLDYTRAPRRSWLDHAGAALCVLPLVAVLAYLVHLAR